MNVKKNMEWWILVNDINWRDGFRIRWSPLQIADGLSPWPFEKGFISEVLYEISWLCTVNWKGTFGSWLITVIGFSLWKRGGYLVCNEQAASPCSVRRKSRRGFLNVMTDVPVKNQAWFLVNENEVICACRQRRYLDSLPNTFQLLVQRDAAEYVSATCAERRCRISFNYLCRETLPNTFQLPVQIDAAEYVSATCADRRCRIRFNYQCRETLPNTFQLLVQRDAAE